jgi:hypothetical protein
VGLKTHPIATTTTVSNVKDQHTTAIGGAATANTPEPAAIDRSAEEIPL